MSRARNWNRARPGRGLTHLKSRSPESCQLWRRKLRVERKALPVGQCRENGCHPGLKTVVLEKKVETDKLEELKPPHMV